MKPTNELKQAVTDYREGKPEAFTPLYEQSCKYIYVRVRDVMSGNENMQDAIGDIMQDTYLEISRSIGQLKDAESFLTWAGMIATRKSYAWLEKNRKYVLLAEEDNTFDNLADDESIIPEEVMQSKEKQRLVRTIIETKLTPMQKICIVSYYFDDRKQAEIARELGIPENTVKTNLSRAKAKIRDGVLDLEKKQGTKLYSVAPLLLLLLKEDVEACTVPYGITAAVQSAAAAAGAQGAASAAGAGAGKTLAGKVAGISLKAKIAAGIAGVGAAVIAGGAAYMALQDKAEPWETEFEKVLLEDEEDGEREEVYVPDEADSEEEAPEESREVTLSEEEREALLTLINLLTFDSHFFGGNMDGYYYPVHDVDMAMTMLREAASFGVWDDTYAKYQPSMEIDNEKDWIGYSDRADIQNYLKNVFGIENADLSDYMEGGRVVWNVTMDIVPDNTGIDLVTAMTDDVYRVTGTAVVIEAGVIESSYPYEMTVRKNDGSPFGYQVLSMVYEDGGWVDNSYAEPAAGSGSLSDILLNPAGNSAYYSEEAGYDKLYFALLDVDRDGKDEILLGNAAELDFNGEPYWITIFNILKYDENTGEAADFDGDMIYRPLDTRSWHFYDTGILMTMAEMGECHTNFWNLLTGEFTDAALWVADDLSKPQFESEGHSRIYRADGPDITGEEADRYYQSLKAGNEIPIVWCEVNPENVEALLTGGSAAAASVPMPFGTYIAASGSILDIYNDKTVTVSEGNSHKTCDFTIDGAGNMVIDPDGEALEAVYDAQNDEIRVGAAKFRKR